jgi:hypothetical protein
MTLDLAAIEATAMQTSAAAQAACARVSELQIALPYDPDGHVAAIRDSERSDTLAREAGQQLEQARDRLFDEAAARTALRDAIAVAAIARQAIAEAEGVHARVGEQLAEAGQVLEAATAAVARARAADTRAAKAGKAGTALRAARAAHCEAEDQVGTLRAALEESEADVREAEAAARAGEQNVQKCADAVVAGPAYELMAEVDAILAQVAAKRSVLEFMQRNAGEARARSIRNFLGKLPFADDASAVAAWQQARAALLLDADAQLPG